MIKLKLGLLVLVCAGVTAVAVRASRAGWGAGKPEKNPVSIREESARQGNLGPGRHRTRYFLLGGGLHRGK